SRPRSRQACSIVLTELCFIPVSDGCAFHNIPQVPEFNASAPASAIRLRDVDNEIAVGGLATQVAPMTTNNCRRVPPVRACRPSETHASHRPRSCDTMYPLDVSLE